MRPSGSSRRSAGCKARRRRTSAWPTIAGRPFTVRELQPTEAKLDWAMLKGGDFDALAAACGTVLGRLHRRANPALAERMAGRERAIARRVCAFALRYAAQVADDHARLTSERAAVAQALGVPSGTGG